MFEKLKQEWEDITIRAAKTAAQAFIAVLLVSNQPFGKQALTAALAAAISAVWNSVKVINKETK